MNIKLSDWSGSGATKELQAAIESYNETASKQAREMIRLTRVIVGLTFALLAGLVVQIYLALAAC